LAAGEGKQLLFTAADYSPDDAIGGISLPATISIASSSYRLHNPRRGCIRLYRPDMAARACLPPPHHRLRQ
jgi:hypothetical protein